MEQNQPVISTERSSEERVRAILDELAALYPDARCELNHSSPFELLVATILSAQSTDARVNMVTERLFRKYNTPEDFASSGRTTWPKRSRNSGFTATKRDIS